ncbi:DNA-binding helix-hairpin-helix protein with protein kinase domain [Bradyrhizobium sp. USDA 4011]
MSRLKSIFDQHRKAIPLGKLLGRGGEGAVFEIVGEPDLAAKIYHPDKARERQQKIVAMAASGIQTQVPNAAFPLAPLYEGTGTFAGFTMRRVGKQKPVHELYSPASRRNEFPNADYRLLVRTAKNIARAVAAVHSSGCVIGDLNHSGILVGGDATATLIDCDSFQFSKDGKTFNCEVGVPDYTPPELQGKSLNTSRTPNHDAFGLGVAIFSLLFLGRHPFSGRYLGRGDMPEERAIAEFRFAYSADKSRTQTEPPPFAPTLSYVPRELATAFEACFGPGGANGGRPKSADWISLLDRAETQLIKCTATAGHYHFSSSPKCPWCALEKAIPGFIAFPSPLNINTTTPLDLGQLIAAIRGVADPGSAPSLDSAMPAVQLTPTVQNKGVLDSSSGQFILATLGGVAAAALLRLGFVPPLISMVALGTSAYFALRNPKQLHASGPRSHQLKQTWDQVDQRYRTEADASRFNDARRQSELRIREYNELPNEEARRLADLAQRQREIQLKYHLERFSLVTAKIKSVGSARKATLRSHGINTAADISRQRIEGIPGFGPATAALLLSWRSDLERRFVFNPSQPVNPGDIAQVKSDIAHRRAALETALKADLITIRTAAAEIQRSRTDLTNRARAIWVEYKQAEADEKVRVFGDVVARRWVYGVACFAAFLVAGATGGGPSAPSVPSTPPTFRSTMNVPWAGSNISIVADNSQPNVSSGGRLSVQPTPALVGNSLRQAPSPFDRLPQEPQKATAEIAAIPPVLPPLDPVREVKSAPQPPTDPTFPSAVTLDPAIGRLKDLGFTASIEPSWTATSLNGLREFKIVNHLPPDSRLDPTTTQALQSPRAITRNRSFLGGWASDPTCTQGTELTISAQEARTEGGVCTFESFLPSRTGWKVRGHCQVGADRWPATIEFAVSGKALSWSSAKGNSKYYRCG